MTYTIKKVLNSSVVLVSDDKDNEYILLGKGIGYGKKSGELVQEDSSNQTFVPVENTKSKQFEELMDDIPIDILTVTQEIIVKAKQLLECDFNKNLYLVLADHLNFAVQRVKDGVMITNRVFWEIKNYYPKEFNAGLVAIYMFEEKTGVQLPEAEAANIAFHFANAEFGKQESVDTMKYAKVIGEINNIVIFSLNRNFDRQGANYMRFVTHIKFFVERYFTNSMLNNEDDILYNRMKENYPKEMDVALKIKSFLENKYGTKLTNEELTFLVVHIARIASNT